MTTQDITGFLVKHVPELLVLFATLIGAIWGGVSSTKLKKLKPADRWLTQVIGFLIVSAFLLNYMFKYEFNGLITGVIGIVAGLFSARFAMTIKDLWTEEDDFYSFLQKGKRLWSAMSEVGEKYRDSAPPEENKPPTTE